MTTDNLADLLERYRERVHAILNILIETPYFYASDDRDHYLFPFLLKHRKAFHQFFEQYYGWELIIDSGQKCARVYKSRWYNAAVPESRRFALQLTRRDETLAFMLLLEFFELELDKQGVSVEEKENLQFHFSDLLAHVHRRLHEEYPRRTQEYTEDAVRKILRELMPKLEQFRLVEKLQPADGNSVGLEQSIFEALPALYHYNGTRLSFPVFHEADRDQASEEAAEDMNGEATINSVGSMSESDTRPSGEEEA